MTSKPAEFTIAKTWPHVGFVSTYPPTTCGLASFTANLRSAMERGRGSGSELGVVRVRDANDAAHTSREVIADMDPADPTSVEAAAKVLSEMDAVVIQHEYGIFGPDSGRSVLDLVARIDAPIITTLHTVLTNPSDLQRQILERLVAASDRTVVLSAAAQQLLADRYDTAGPEAIVIPHGTNAIDLRSRNGYASRPTLLTWGLIGPGKGLEFAVEATARLRGRFPSIRYIIAGRTHPKVLDAAGEAYRRSLEDRVARLGLEDNVEFVDEYLDPSTLAGLLRQTSVVMLPYESTEQVVSGVLVEAIAANVPVVATAFPHAREMAAAGAAMATPHNDPEALAGAVQSLLSSAGATQTMLSAQRKLATALSWSSVAEAYEQLAVDVLRVQRIPAGQRI